MSNQMCAACGIAGTVQPEQNARSVPWRMRFEHTKELWPYMAPLFLVFASEYAMQSGGCYIDRNAIKSE